MDNHLRDGGSNDNDVVELIDTDVVVVFDNFSGNLVDLIDPVVFNILIDEKIVDFVTVSTDCSLIGSDIIKWRLRGLRKS